MSDSPFWQVTLVNSSDLSEIGLLDHPFSFNPIFNRAGSLSMTIPLDDEISYSVVKHSTAIMCVRNTLPVWSGSIVTVERDPGNMTLSLTAIGWLQELSKRFVMPAEEATLSFNEVPGGQIAQVLLDTANAQLDSSGVARSTHVLYMDPYNNHASQVRTRSYKRGQNYGQALQELVDVENGFDMTIDPVGRYMTTSDPTSYSDRTGVMFGFNTEPFNLVNAVQTDDGTNTANSVIAVGSNGVLVSADDPGAIDAAGVMMQNWVTLSDVNSATIIGAYANAELVYQRYGTVTYNLQINSIGDIPRPYDDFQLGDKVYLSINAGALQVESQAVRVFGMTIDIDSTGNEIISQIVTSPQ